MNVWYKYSSKIYILLYLFNFFLKINEVKCQTINCNSATSIYLSDIYRNFAVAKVIYKTDNDYNNNPVSLRVDIYSPLGAANTKRPTIIIYVGGGFKGTFITSETLRYWADKFTAKGYNVFIPTYRTGWNNFDVGLCGAGKELDFDDAMYRAWQDERDLIEFITSKQSTYLVDTNNIYLMGYSAGALLIMNRVGGLDKLSTSERVQRLGELKENNVAGIITLAGATVSRQYNANLPPLLMFHGTCDAAVPFEEGRLADCGNLAYFYGSGTVYNDLKTSNCVQLHAFCSYDHDFKAVNESDSLAKAFEYVTNTTAKFIYDQLCAKSCESKAFISNDYLTDNVVNINKCHPVNGNFVCSKYSSPENNIQLVASVLNGDNNMKILVQAKEKLEANFEIFDIMGKKVFEKYIFEIFGINTIDINLPKFTKGIYLVVLKNDKNILAKTKLLIADE
jgi:poly(3-hydroxybutyrate) depolymerase